MDGGTVCNILHFLIFCWMMVGFVGEIKKEREKGPNIFFL